MKAQGKDLRDFPGPELVGRNRRCGGKTSDLKVTRKNFTKIQNAVRARRGG